VRYLAYLNSLVQARAVTTPMAREATIVSMNWPIVPATNANLFLSSIFSSNIPPTTLKRMMATASLTIPSPNTTENSLGYFSGLMIVKAATLSVAQIVALNLTIRAVERAI
jgi:hypothetical protein